MKKLAKSLLCLLTALLMVLALCACDSGSGSGDDDESSSGTSSTRTLKALTEEKLEGRWETKFSFLDLMGDSDDMPKEVRNKIDKDITLIFEFNDDSTVSLLVDDNEFIDLLEEFASATEAYLKDGGLYEIYADEMDMTKDEVDEMLEQQGKTFDQAVESMMKMMDFGAMVEYMDETDDGYLIFGENAEYELLEDEDDEDRRAISFEGAELVYEYDGETIKFVDVEGEEEAVEVFKGVVLKRVK